MILNLKRWFTSYDSPLAETKKETVQNQWLDYNDMAFQLASANNINETLPVVLSSLQSQLNVSLDKQAHATLLVLFSSPATSETWLHHAHMDGLPSNFTQTLHHHFTIKKTMAHEIVTLHLDSKILKLLPITLCEYGQQTIWLLYLFENNLPNLKQFKWKTATIESTLIKGLRAWCQSESKIKAALENERSIYAAELHDSLAQILGYLKIKSAKLDKLCQLPPHQELKPISEELAAYTHCAYHQTRELIVSSRLTLQSENLSTAVTNSINEFEQQSAIVFELDNRLQSQALTPKETLQILYIIRESLSNIVRHSHASHAFIRLYMTSNDLLHIVVEDDGTGIDPLAARSDSFGLQIMHERAERIGAELKITDRPEGGTRVSLSLNTGENR